MSEGGMHFHETLGKVGRISGHFLANWDSEHGNGIVFALGVGMGSCGAVDGVAVKHIETICSFPSKDRSALVVFDHDGAIWVRVVRIED